MAVPKRQADLAHIVAPARTFHLTSSTLGKRNALQSERMATLLIDVLLKNAEAGRFLLHAFVVMRDHIHVLLTVTEAVSVEKAAQYIKGGFSFRAKKEVGYQGEIWQPGFSEDRVLTAEQFFATRDYIHMNPVRKRMCCKPEEFPYSSASGKFPVSGSPEHLRG